MAFLSGYTKRWEYKVLATKVPSTQTDFPVYVDLSAMPASFWSTVANGGGDIRVTRSDGTTECAREVVSCDTATDTGELHFLANSVDGTTDTVFYIYANGTSADYAVTATYGAEAVWGDYVLVSHMNDATDSTGNRAAATNTGVTFASSVAQIGNAAEFNGTTDFLSFADANDFSLLESGDVVSVQCWMNQTTSQAGNIYSKNGEWAAVTNPSGGSASTVFFATFGGNSGLTANSFAIDTWHKVDFIHTAGVGGNIYVGGVNENTDTNANLSANGTNPLVIGQSGTGAGYFRGYLDELRLRKSALTQNWITTEYNNQNDHSTFATIGAEETDGGGGATFNNYKGFSRL